MANALSILVASFSDCGLIAEGETLTAPMAQDGLRRLNALCSTLRTQFQTVTSIDREVFALTADKNTYTIGVGGDFNVVRPLTVVGAGLLLNGLDAAVSVTITRVGYVATVTQTGHGYAVGDETLIAGANELLYNGVQVVETVPTANTFTFTVEGTPVSPATGTITAAPLAEQPLEIPRTVITDDAYQSIQFKTLSNAQFTNVYYNPTFPFGTIFLWPMPNVATNQLVLYLQNAFTGFADLTTNYDFPDLPGYSEMLQYNLDLRLFGPYAVNEPAIMQSLRERAAESMGLIKRANNKLTDLPTDASLLAWNRRGGYNINTGTGGY